VTCHKSHQYHIPQKSV